MQALQFDRMGSLEALTQREVPMPIPGNEDVLIKVHAAGVNPSDIKNVLGRFPYTTVPRIPGRDFSGVVIEGPTEWRSKAVWGSGSGVGFTRDGAHAEYLAFPIAGLSLKPESLSFVEAASCGVPYITALEMLDRSGVQANTQLLVIGAAGAVGTAAIAMATQRGARILAAVRKTQQQSALQQQGINTVLLQDSVTLPDQVREFFPEGAEVVLDTTGAQLPAAVSALRTHGTIVVIAAPAEGHITFPLLDFYRRGAQLVGVNSLLHKLPDCAKYLDKLRTEFDRGGLKAPRHIQEYTLQEGTQVYQAVHQGHSAKPVFVF